jgi:uncharacterized protein (DUF1697 family)
VQAKTTQEKSRRIVRNVWIALFRGINVGGNNLLPMRELAALLGKLGAHEVKTYIQSGNAVFRHASEDASVLAQRIGRAVEQAHGFAPRVLVLTREQLAQVVAANPFRAQVAEPTTVHVLFLAAPPSHPDLAALERVKAASESFALCGTCCYLHTPEGLARSKLAERAERLLGVAGTARNWRTVGKLLELAQAMG